MQRFIAKTLLIFVMSFGTLFPQTYDQIITDVNSHINQDSVTFYIQSLQDFGTRFEYSDNRKEVANWLQEQYLSMGFEQVELDSFMCSAGWDQTPKMQYNVVATLPGSERPDQIYIIGGHYDSYNNQDDPMNYAPGADDNASGTAGAMETARAIMAAGYQPEATIQFVAFAAEELMLSGNSGSEYMAAKYRDENKNVRLMINHDMIANNPRPLEESMVSVNYYTGSEHLKEIAIGMMKEYSAVKPMEGGRDTWTDSRSFHEEGFPAVYYDEHDFSPNYHSSDDVIENCDMEYCTEVIKGGAAMLIYSIEAPSIVREFTAYDVGNGTSIKLEWNRSNESKVTHYNIYYGESEEELTLYDSTSNTVITVANLSDGTFYYFGIKAVDSDGNESYIATTSGTPNSLPLSPASVRANPEYHQIKLEWAPNEELDIIGYKITKVPQTTYDYFPSLTFYTSDTVLIDTEVESGIWYDYQVAAMDADSNLSINNPVFSSRAVTMDRGILFVNETSLGDGSLGNPTYGQLEEFYFSLPALDYESYNVNIEEESDFGMANLGAHHTLIWHSEKGSNNRQDFVELVREYLQYGGNILFTGYKPASFSGYSGLVTEYTGGDFVFDYLGIEQSENGLLALNNGALSEAAGYPILEFDSDKISSADGHLRNIEVIVPNADAGIIYSYSSDYGDGSPQGTLKGKPVGLVKPGIDYNVVLLSIPLYYVKQEQAAEFINYVLGNVFNTPTDIENEEESVPNNFVLKQNYPNPFNPTTSIEYQVSSSERVSLKVFDVLGREVKTLVNEQKAPGTFSVTFDASNLSSGIYFYTLKSGSFTQTRKMILLR